MNVRKAVAYARIAADQAELAGCATLSGMLFDAGEELDMIDVEWKSTTKRGNSGAARVGVDGAQSDYRSDCGYA